MKRSPTRSKIFLFAILSLFIGGLMLIVAGCPGTIDPCAVDNTKFCAVLKEYASASVQAGLEDCHNELTICDGEQIELYWTADSAVTSNVKITGPGGESIDFPLEEGHVTMTPHVSGEWKVEFSGKCTFHKSITVRVIKGEEPWSMVAKGNVDIGFFSDINPKSVSKNLIVTAIRSSKCADNEKYCANWSCTKANWDGSNGTGFNVSDEDSSTNNTHLPGHWEFHPLGLSGNITYPEKTACFILTIRCEKFDIYPTPTPTPWPTRSPR